MQATIDPLQQEINQLGRQFCVSKEQVKANNYDLSASRYRQVEQDDVFYEKPEVTLERMRELEEAAADDIVLLSEMISEESLASLPGVGHDFSERFR